MYKGISKNSKEIKKDYIYFCFGGNHNNGYDYIEEAIQNGATKIVGEKNLELSIYEKVEDVNLAMIEYAKEIYNNPQDELNLIGVTGTDGKTSTALIINQILNNYSKSAYLGTNGFIIENNKKEYTDFTTPFADKLFPFFSDAKEEKCENFVMEVSSHALEQNRIGNLEFSVCIFTNLSSEHLDFHKNMKNYYEAKKKLFQKINKDSKLVINIDDEYGLKLKEELNNTNTLTISTQNSSADFYIKNISQKIDSTIFELVHNEITYTINSPLLATFNVYNLVEAIAAIQALGYSIDEIVPCISSLVVPGRLEIIPNDRKITIIIDFAHTPTAIQKVMNFIKDIPEVNKIHVLTGSAGQRDQMKRPQMGDYASQYADFLYLTEDDPRDEKVKNIIEDLKSGIKNEKCIIIEEENRQTAINLMLQNASENDVLILFGKGAMEYMYYNGYKQKYSEKEIIKEGLKK